VQRRTPAIARIIVQATAQDKKAIAAKAKAAAERAGAAIDDALDFIAASDKRIEAMEAQCRPPCLDINASR
jgi:hypothetical protein